MSGTSGPATPQFPPPPGYSPSPASPPAPPLPPMYPAAPFPPPPPPPKSHVGLIIAVVLIVVAVIVVASVLSFFFFLVPRSQVTVTGVNWSILYQGNRSGYFDSASLTSCSSCPIQLQGASQYSYVLSLTNHDPVNSHNVTAIDVTFPWTEISTTPSTPFSVSASGTVSITIDLIVPPEPGSSVVLSGTVTTT